MDGTKLWREKASFPSSARPRCQENFPFLFGVKEAQAVPILIDNRAALTVANYDE